MSDFTEKLAFGEEGEKVVMEYLLNQGRICLPMYQFNPKTAPKIMTPYGEVTSPDFITIHGRNRTIYAESKRKKMWVTSYNHDTERETGIDNRHFKAYCQLVKVTGTPLELYFIHEEMDPKGLYRIVLKEVMIDEWVKERRHFRFDYMITQGGKNTPMIFFPYEMLEKIY